MVDSKNWIRAILFLVILTGIFFIFYGVFGKSIWYIIFQNLWIIFGTVVTIIGVSVFIIGEEELKDNRIDILINSLAIIATVAAALMGAYLGTSGSRDLWTAQNHVEQQNVANALYLEISSLHEDWSTIIPLYTNNTNSNEFLVIHSTRPYYSEKGLYYSFQPVIASYNSNLSTSIFSFYSDVMKADYYRNNVIQDTNSLNGNYVINLSEFSYSSNSSYNYTESDIEIISKAFPWGNDDQLRSITLAYYDPTATKDENEKWVDSARSSLFMQRSIIKADNEVSCLLSELNKTRNDPNSVTLTICRGNITSENEKKQ